MALLSHAHKIVAGATGRQGWVSKGKDGPSRSYGRRDQLVYPRTPPRKAVVSEIEARFTNQPLVLMETVAYHLKADAGLLLSQPRGSLVFAEAVARAQQFDRRHFKSLAQYFGVSAQAMAIRLEELELVSPYLYV